MFRRADQNRTARLGSRPRQRGVAIVTAIFLLVVLSALGAYMLTVSSTQSVAAAQDIQGSKAYQAARAGAEWGVFQILRNNGGAYAAACRAGSTTQNIPAMAGMLAGFSVSVRCDAISYTEGARTTVNPLWVYQLTSTATMGGVGTNGYVDRQVRISLEN